MNEGNLLYAFSRECSNLDDIKEMINVMKNDKISHFRIFPNSIYFEFENYKEEIWTWKDIINFLNFSEDISCALINTYNTHIEYIANYSMNNLKNIVDENRYKLDAEFLEKFDSFFKTLPHQDEILKYKVPELGNVIN